MAVADEFLVLVGCFSSFILLFGSVGSGVTGQIGVRLHGMGRDGRFLRCLCHLDGKYSSPNYNVMIVGGWPTCALLLNYDSVHS
jgi:hypothetical protein